MPEPHRLLRGHSVETNLSSFPHEVVPIDQNCKQTDVYFNRTKAFDKVDHQLLLAKLNMYGVCVRHCNLRNPLCFLMLFYFLVPNLLEFASVVGNFIGVTNSSSIECIKKVCFMNMIEFVIRLA